MSTPPRRQSKQSRDELRATLLEAGREILREEGLETGSANLTFKRVFERVEKESDLRVTNASVIRRVWENQADYQADVLVTIARDVGRPEAALTVDAVASVLNGIGLSEPEARQRALTEVCRVGGAASTDAIAASANWSLWINVVAVAQSTSDPERRRRIKEALAEGYETVAVFWDEAYLGLAASLGYRVASPWTIRDFTTTVTALSEGCSLRQRISGRRDTVRRPTGPGGEEQEWTMFAVGLETMVATFFEPDPDYVPPTG